MKKFFKLEENKTTVKTEIIAGITTFLAMAYILAVNPGPDALGAIAGVSRPAIFMATAISAAIATICMAFFANYPVALASGMGLNSFFAFTVCGTMGYSYEVALTAVLIEGIIFMILSLFKFREALVNKIPTNLKFGITAGIGLFITIIALKGSGAVIAYEPTLVKLGDLGSASVALSIIGLIIIGVLQYKKVPGGILLGILITWVLGMIAETCGWYQGISTFPDFSWESIKANFAAPALFKFDFGFIVKDLAAFAIVVFTFLYTDIFDTVGTLIGVTQKAGLMKQDGTLPKAGGALMADAIGTVAGACLGTSTVTSYVESSAGVAAGGKTGLTALTTGILFLLAIPLAPIFLAIPGFATAPAMIYVGVLMFSAIKNMDFDGDAADVIGGFLAVVMMPFAYSIATGIMFGIVSWVILKVLMGKVKDISGIMWISFLLFAVYIVLKAMGYIQ
ncbi:MAG: NCS2 family permease [Ruminococcaceae bacterium]|nr:NCS2 family permease [Oscillospiraceae bacterium]